MTFAAAAPASRVSARHLIDSYSLEMTAKDIASLEQAARLIPPGTRLSITFLPGEETAGRVAAAVQARRLGFVPVPHISARRIVSEAELTAYLEALVEQAAVEDVFIIAGDPAEAMGPYEDSLAVIRSGLLHRFGIRHVGIAGHPEGHPVVSEQVLRTAMLDKQAELESQQIDCSIMTQFSFNADPILSWLRTARSDGVVAPVRVGVPGPASIKTLLRFAARCGVGASASVMKKYGVSITKLLGTAGPDPLVNALAESLDPALHGEVLLHLYPFGGLERTAAWAQAFGRTGRG